MRVVVIPARYGSTRFPGKPLARIAGKPLIQWVYEGASQSRRADLVVVATDDERIADCVRSFGGEVYMTPECPTGSDRVAYVLRRFGEDWQFVVNVQGDEPLVKGYVVDAVFDALDETPDAIVTLMRPVENDVEYTDPNVVKVVVGARGYALYFSRAPIPFFRKRGRAFCHIGIYGFHRNTLLSFVELPRGELEETEQLEQLRALENGMPIRVIETTYRSVGVDVPEDIAKVEKLLRGDS